MLRGLSVTEVERDIPIFGRGNRTVRLERGRCARYAMDRSSSRSSLNWQFLQRTEHEGAQFPNGFLLVKNEEDVPPDLQRELGNIAREFDEEYFEFEGAPKQVCVYWEEWGGSKQVRRLYDHLQAIANAY